VEIVVAAMLLSAPTRPLSRTAAAISSREGAAVVEDGRPASSLEAAMARRISARYSAVWSSTIPITRAKEKCSCAKIKIIWKVKLNLKSKSIKR
jgi:hypothetical protein